MKSLRATEKNNQEEDVTNASDDNDDGGSTSDKKNKKRRNKSLENEYLVARLESLYDASAAAVTSSSSLLESLTDEYYDQDDVVSSSSSSPGQSLLYGEENVVVLGDWMEWEEGGSCLGDYCGDDSEVSIVPWTVQFMTFDVIIICCSLLFCQLKSYFCTHHPFE